MEWTDIASKIASVAPGLGAAFGGPAGAAVGLAVKAVASIFGLSDTATPDQISQAITQDPEAALKLRLAELDYNLKVKQIDFEERDRQRGAEIEQMKTRLTDVQNARQREVEITRITGRRDMLQFWLAVFGWLAPVGLVAYLVIRGLPSGISADAAALLGGFIGIIIGEYKTIYQYFFGSSKGSDHKTDLLAKAEPIK